MAKQAEDKNQEVEAAKTEESNEKVVNTTESIKKPKGAMSQAEMDREVKRAGAKLEKAKKVKIKLPKYLAGRLGPVLPLGINGAVIYVAVDGKEYEIPAPYKKILDQSVENLNL